ncbi:uracil-DNA glycosylase family protein [Tengunoibacter tsumagoiensis]|uniref:Uracil-DNA glycosylase n=1 Tax=Tengunoibacter tsumagoiensis TaxID=2014871 RepID=A0A402A0T2_9CHLR|nr:uracil-DNA glycosylase family protein [Tengunoibacter tsumagoiensis]GCE12666.1 uracil-DNA glycosylase [Tengunoibacter tsumagoiensis]
MHPSQQPPVTKGAALKVLQQQIRSCTLCQQHGYLQAVHPIVSGRATDRLMVIGQAPGHRSVAKNLPFSGPGGMVLQKWLERAGFPEGYLHDRAYLSSLTRCNPGKNTSGSGDRRPSPPEIALCRPYLEQELLLLQPRVVLLVGSMAIEAFLGKARLEEIIGTYQQRDMTFFLPLPHPSGVSRWLNAPAHQYLHQQALQLLAEWRITYQL